MAELYLAYTRRKHWEFRQLAIHVVNAQAEAMREAKHPRVSPRQALSDLGVKL